MLLRKTSGNTHGGDVKVTLAFLPVLAGSIGRNGMTSEEKRKTTHPLWLTQHQQD